jgi:hypothetical protein
MTLLDRQAQMGHATGKMMHHTHSDLERRRAAVESIANRLMGEATGTIN